MLVAGGWFDTTGTDTGGCCCCCGWVGIILRTGRGGIIFNTGRIIGAVVGRIRGVITIVGIRGLDSIDVGRFDICGRSTGRSFGETVVFVCAVVGRIGFDIICGVETLFGWFDDGTRGIYNRADIYNTNSTFVFFTFRCYRPQTPASIFDESYNTNQKVQTPLFGTTIFNKH